MLLIFITLFLCPPSIGAQPLVIANGEWAPYFSANANEGGVGSNICKAAFSQEGIDVDFEFMPWKRAFELTKSGQYIATVGWMKTEIREKNFYFSDALFSDEIVFFHMRGRNFHWEKLEEVGGMTIGVSLGYDMGTELKPAVRKHGGVLQTAPTDVLNFQKLQAGRIDLFPCSKQVGLHLLKTIFPKDTPHHIQYTSRSLLSPTLHLIIPKSAINGQELIQTFNKGLKKLRESGQYDCILKKAFAESQ